jgi:hypothetical protein
VISLSNSVGRGLSSSGSLYGGDGGDPTVTFGHDTQKSIDDFFGMVKTDLDKRIQEAIHEVEQKFLDRVQKLEQHTAALAGAPLVDPSMDPMMTRASGGSLMDSLSRPLPADMNPGGSLALRKEILSHVTDKVGDLDLRVNQMEVLVSYKLVDIESKVKTRERRMKKKKKKESTDRIMRTIVLNPTLDFFFIGQRPPRRTQYYRTKDPSSGQVTQVQYAGSSGRRGCWREHHHSRRRTHLQSDATIP